MQLMSELMCTLCVHISGTTLQTPLNYLHVLLMALLGPVWWHCNMLFTSGYVDDVIFLITDLIAQATQEGELKVTHQGVAWILHRGVYSN